ncbi:MAG: hypothetical protein JWP00_710 [Chloroflexi bacterium]|jgi:hypothetical protein|nr:hypothetical protein [Chloroflexota bacterium]
MPTLVPVMIKDPSGALLLTLNVPLEYTAARLLADLVEASDLDLVEPTGTLLRYELARTDGKPLPAHTTFFTTGLLRGEALFLRQIRTGRKAPRPALQALHQARLELEEDLDYIDNRASQKPENAQAVSYWKDALRWQVCQSYEPALQILLEKRQELIDSLNTLTQPTNRPYQGGSGAALLAPDPTQIRNDLAILTGEIKTLFREALGSQMTISGYEPFAELLALSATEAFLKADRAFRAELMEMFIRGSYLLGRSQRYKEARDFATLAKKLEPDNEIATALEWMGQQYLSFQAAIEPEDRLELARSIYAADETYGNIAQDLREVVRQTRDGPSKPLGRQGLGPGYQDQPPGYGYPPGGQPGYQFPAGGSYPGMVGVSSGPGNRPSGPRKRSLIQVVYPWVISFLILFTLAVLCYWILAT